MCEIITEPTPAFINSRNGTNSVFSNLSREKLMTGKPRCESTFVSPCPGKCFAVARTFSRLQTSRKSDAERVTSIGIFAVTANIYDGIIRIVIDINDGSENLLNTHRFCFAPDNNALLTRKFRDSASRQSPYSKGNLPFQKNAFPNRFQNRRKSARGIFAFSCIRLTR